MAQEGTDSLPRPLLLHVCMVVGGWLVGFELMGSELGAYNSNPHRGMISSMH